MKRGFTVSLGKSGFRSTKRYAGSAGIRRGHDQFRAVAQKDRRKKWPFYAGEQKRSSALTSNSEGEDSFAFLMSRNNEGRGLEGRGPRKLLGKS